jgi:hypothetical protein
VEARAIDLRNMVFDPVSTRRILSEGVRRGHNANRDGHAYPDRSGSQEPLPAPADAKA